MQFFSSICDGTTAGEGSSYAEFTQGKIIAASIGNFDGVHLGHRTLCERLRNTDLDLRLIVSFAPHPRVALKRFASGADDGSFKQLTPLRRKCELFDQLGLDLFYCQRFTRELAELSPEAFFETILCRKLGIAHLVIGDEWRFGKRGEGDAGRAKSLGEKLGIAVTVLSQLSRGESRVSSSRIRALISSGELPAAKELLGRHYDISGRVLHGAKRGRTLGFPTANIRAGRALLPPYGVYASMANLASGKRLPSVTSIGVRPVYESAGEPLVETHIIGGASFDLYGQRLRVELLEMLRAEIKFASERELLSQMHRDRDDALTFCKAAENS